VSEKQVEVADIVHFVVDDVGCRAAIVVKALEERVNLRVFLDRGDPAPGKAPNHAEAPFLWMADAVPYSKTHKPGSWHWPHAKT
jgi:hypothetical protein